MPLLAGARVVALDTETTGISPRFGSALLEVATVTVEDGRIVAEWSTLVRPGRPIPADATRVHGITDAMVAGAAAPGAALDTLRGHCRDGPVALHHAAFDLPFLAEALRREGRPPLLNPVIDTLGLARGLAGEGHSLAALAARHGLPAEPPHRALGDARTTARLLIVLAEVWERECGITTLDQLAAASQDVLRRGRSADPALAR